MTSEAAVWVPSLRCNSFAGRISYLEEEEHKYGRRLIYSDNFDALLGKLCELVARPDLKKSGKLKGRRCWLTK